MKQLVHAYDNYALSVSMTTRKPRPGEQEGREYFFVTREEFEEKIEQNGLVEYAQYCDNYYGTPREYVEKQLEKGKDVILEIETKGALNVKRLFPEAVFLAAPARCMLGMLSRLSGAFASLPFAALTVTAFTPAACLLLYGAMLSISQYHLRPLREKLLIASGCLAGACVFLAASAFSFSILP